MRPLDSVLADIEALVRRYVVLTDEQACAVALWVAHAHLVDGFDVSPPLAVVSAEKRSGKTRLLDVAELLVPRPWRAITPSEAVVYRYLDAEKPTLMLDEVDAIFGRPRETTEGLRALLNAGNQRGTRVPRCTGPTSEIVQFGVFGPKVLAGIGELPDTITDRSLVVEMRRRTKGEPVSRFRRRVAVVEAERLAGELAERAGYADEAVGALEHVERLADDGQPLAALDDRRFEQVWEPLLAVAWLAGERWLDRAITAALALTDGDQDGGDSIAVRLLADIRAVFEQLGDRVTSHTLAELLSADESSPWADWYGKPVTPRAIARLLQPFKIRPRNIKMPDGTVPKGYRLEDFHDAFTRYTPEKAATSATTAYLSQKPAVSVRYSTTPVADAESAANPHEQADVAEVAAKTLLPGDEGYVERLFAALEAEWITPGEWTRGERLHRYLAAAAGARS